MLVIGDSWSVGLGQGDLADSWAGRLPGEVQEDGSIALDRVPYRAMRGGFTAAVARWPEGTDVRAALEALGPRDPS